MLTSELRQYIREERSYHVKSLRRRDSRMLSDVKKSLELISGQSDQEGTPVGQVRSDDLENLNHALS